jgi:hypothetical protein
MPVHEHFKRGFVALAHEALQSFGVALFVAGMPGGNASQHLHEG